MSRGVFDICTEGYGELVRAQRFGSSDDFEAQLHLPHLDDAGLMADNAVFSTVTLVFWLGGCEKRPMCYLSRCLPETTFSFS